MIEAKQSLTGALNNAVEYVQPHTQEKGVTPSVEIQEVTPDTGFTGLSKVTVDPIPSEYSKVEGTIDITSNGEYDVKSYEKANVSIGGFEITNAYYLFYKGYRIDAVNELCALISDKCTDFSYMFRDASDLTEIPKFNTTNGTTFKYTFNGCRGLTKGPDIDFSKSTNNEALFLNCSGMIEIPEYDFSSTESLYEVFAGCTLLTNAKITTSEKLKNARALFNNCSKLKEVGFFNTSNVTDFRDTFKYCGELTSIPFIDTSNGLEFGSMFADARKLASLPNLNTSKAQNVSFMFNRCYALLEIPELDFGSVTNVSNILNEMPNITTLGGFKDLGKGYLTSSSANYSNYKLDLSRSPSLTHDSLMNVINKLYDIASVGVKSQQLVLGSTNLAKLTEEEIAIATNKGWTVS